MFEILFIINLNIVSNQSLKIVCVSIKTIRNSKIKKNKKLN